MFRNLNKYKDLIILLTIIILLIVFIFLISSTLSYFKKSTQVSGNIQLGELDFTINVSNISNKLYLPGDTVDLNINIENKSGLKTNLVPFYFRFKIIKGDENYKSDYISLTTAQDFITDDNYYYYKNKVFFGDKVELLKNLVIDTRFTDQDIKSLEVYILVDAVQSEYGAYKEIFHDAPLEWVEFIENN